MATIKLAHLTCRLKTPNLRDAGRPRQLHSPRKLHPDATTVSSKKRMTRRKAPQVPRIVDKKCASKVAATLKDHIDPQALVIECYPGKGVLTHELQRQGIQYISCWEPDDQFFSALKALQQSQDQLEVHAKSFFHVKGNPKEEDFSRLTKKAWKYDPQVKVISLLHPGNTSLFMSKNVHNMAASTFPHSKGRAEFFFFVTGREHQLMVERDGAVGAMNGPVPRRIYDYELFYDISSLLKVPTSAFDRQLNFGHIPKTAHWDQDNYYLMKITPRSDLFSSVCRKQDFQDFCLFTQQLFRLRRARLIPRLEQWCPSLGLVALECGYSMMDTVKQVQAQDLPLLFKELKSKGGIEALKEDVNDHGETLEDPLQSLGLDKTDEQTITEINIEAEAEERLVNLEDRKNTHTFQESFIISDYQESSVGDDVVEQNLLTESVDSKDSTSGFSKDDDVSKSVVQEPRTSKDVPSQSELYTEKLFKDVETFVTVPSTPNDENYSESLEHGASSSNMNTSTSSVHSEPQQAEILEQKDEESEELHHKDNPPLEDKIPQDSGDKSLQNKSSIQLEEIEHGDNRYVLTNSTDEYREQNESRTDSEKPELKSLEPTIEYIETSSNLAQPQMLKVGQNNENQPAAPEVTPKKTPFWKRWFRGE